MTPQAKMRNILCHSILWRMAIFDHFPSSEFMVGRVRNEQETTPVPGRHEAPS